MQFLDGGKPSITYPCTWTYKVIGLDERSLRDAIAEVLGERAHTVSLGNASTGGKYVSLGVEVQVFDDAQRLQTFERLAAQPAISFVI